MIDDRRLLHLAATQRSLVTVEQARTLGYDRHQRQRLFNGRRWERYTPRVLRLVGSADTVDQRAMAAVLDAGAAGSSGSSAAAWWGIPGNQLEPFHVVRLRDRSDTPDRSDGVTSRQTFRTTTLSSWTGSRPRCPPGVVRRRGLAARRGQASMVCRADGTHGRQRWSAPCLEWRHLALDARRPGTAGSARDPRHAAGAGSHVASTTSRRRATSRPAVIKVLADAGLPAMRRQVDTGDERRLDRTSRPPGSRCCR